MHPRRDKRVAFLQERCALFVGGPSGPSFFELRQKQKSSGLKALLEQHRVGDDGLDYIGTGVNFTSRPPAPSSSSQIAPSGPCSTSRMRRPMA